MQSFVPRDAFVLKIQRELCRPKSFGTFEKRAPGHYVGQMIRPWIMDICDQINEILYELRMETMNFH